MKNIALVAIAIAGALLLSSCSHNAELLGIGSAFRIGSGEASLWYGDGLFLNNVSRENVKFNAELDSTMGVVKDPENGSYKGIKALSLEVGPQLGGYARELGEKNPEALKSYYDALAKYYEYRGASDALPASSKSAISDDKSKEATTSISDIIKKAIDKAKSIISKKEQEEGGSDKLFVCDGNCSYEDISGNDDIAYQMSAATKLLTYDGYTHKFEDTGEYFTNAIEHFLTQLVRCQEKGKTTTPMRIKRVKVEDKVIVDLMFVMRQNDRDIETSCPSCWGDISEM